MQKITSEAEVHIRELIRKGEQAQAQQVSDLNWDRRARLPQWMTHRMAIWTVSQLHHGEVATAHMCHALRDDVSASARAFLETQYLDEMRHADLFARYLDKLGGVATPSSVLQNCYRQALAWQGPPQAIMLAFHVILEGENLRMQNSAGTWMTCPLFKEVSAAVARDEARHVAFGRTYLRETLPGLQQHQRLDIYVWLRELWQNGVSAIIHRLKPPRLLRNTTVGGFLNSNWRERRRDLEGAGLFSLDEHMLFHAK